MAKKSYPMVSIVTPSYNQGRFIEDCIISVLSQDYPNIEYIIIDGGSKDDSLETIIKYEHHISYWVSEKDGGSSDAINKGWKRATGDYLWFLNSDDLLRDKHVISDLVAFLESNIEIAFVYGDIIFIDENLNYIGSKTFPDFEFMDLVLHEGQYPYPGCLMRKELLNSIGYFDNRFRSADDLDYLLRIAAKHNIAHLPRHTGCFRIHRMASTQARTDINAEEILKVYEKMLKAPDCPDQVMNRQREIWGKAHRCAASGYFHNGKAKKTLMHLIKAVSFWPRYIFNPKIITLFFLGLLSNKGMILSKDIIHKFIRQP